MNHVYQRLALLTGVSMSALGLASPASAATDPGFEHVVTAPDVSDTLTICDVGDACAFGVTDSGAGTVTAFVNSVASGQVRQVGTATAAGGTVDLHMTNGGDAAFIAAATASSAAGLATALASIDSAIQQTGFGSGDIALDLTNDGTLLIDAGAFASAMHALAAATVNGAIHQYAQSSGTGDASAAFVNASEFGIGVSANANGVTGATAVADVYGGIGNYANALGSGDAFGSVVNSGDILVSAEAAAAVEGTAGTAYAVGFISNAIQQTVYAQSGLASGSIDNSGMITVAANAFASGVTTAPIAGTSAVNATAQALNSFAIDQTGTAASGDVALDFNNSGTIDITVNATAVAGIGGSGTEAGIAFASAYMHDPLYQHAYAPGGDINIDAINDGEFDVSAVAQATGAIGIAQAQVEYGISQYASDAGGDASVSLVNTGTIDEAAGAVAQATSGFAFGLAVLTSAVFQLASAAGDASVDFNNSGTLDAYAVATADGVTGAGAGAFLNFAINQFAIASGAAVAAMTNSGSIDLDAVAVAHAATGGATGIAFVSHALSQHAYGGSAANVVLTNSGHIAIAATGMGTADEFRAFGEAGIFDGIFQSASASGAATASFLNSGTLEVSAHAYGEGGQVGRAIAVIAPAIIQEAWGADARVTLDNSGKIDVAAIAQATGGFGAPALAEATGIVQLALSGTANLVNSGTIAVTASAKATDTGSSAFVGVDALGVLQVGHNSLNQFDNSGILTVKAIGQAGGNRGYEGGSATGFYVRGDSAELDVSNSGTIDVEALASAPDGARMEAIGIRADAIGGSAATSTQPALMSGSIDNDGLLNVVAHATGGGPVVTQTFSGATLTFDQSSAQAIGISMYVGAATATITNTGTIDVEAVTGNGGPADAHGIWVQGNGTGLPPSAGDVLTINNSGDIIARQSTDGGDTWQRGMAIDVSTAPNASVINLLGGGVIYGNIAVQAGDAINVEDGTTYFDGIINPAYLPAGGITAADLDSGLFGVGTLNIGSGGNLILADPRITGPASMYDGPAYALVHTLNVSSDGTLTFELQPATGGSQPVGSYPQVFADTANLDGTLAADVTTVNGLFADSYSWNNVIDANARNGTFDRCVTGGAHAGSVLLNVACSYDSGANVDLTLTRVAFDAVAGLNGNGASAGAGLEGVYSTSLTGGAAHLFHDLFLISDAADYNEALNELSGSAYANYLQSFPSLGVHYDDLLDHATNCEVPALAGSVLECRTNPIHVWGQLDYQARRADGDVEGGTAKSKRFTGLLGVDASVGNAAVLGLSAGRVTNHVRDRQFGDNVDADGMQVGAYAVYDPGALFVKGVTTYSWYDGDSTRHIDFAPFGGTFHGTPAGDPDVRMWTAGLHGGARVPVGPTSTVTPYVNLDYVHAKLKGFTETGLEGANLTVEGGKSNRAFATAGVKWAGQVGGVIPEVNVAYRYRFGNSRSRFTAAFLGDTGSDFDIVSASQKRGTFLAGLSVGGKLGPVDLRIGYEGEFNGDVTSHSGNFKLVLPLGGHAAPPPAPAPVMAPPPPPAPVETAPEAAPPPPPPAQSGERG